MKKSTQNLISLLLGSGLAASFLDPLSARVEGLVSGAVSQAQNQAKSFTRDLIQMIAVTLLAFTGVVFALIGLALYLESQGSFAGSGLVYTGFGVVLFALVSLLVMKSHKK
jgi:FtsH-binding integral membrane protein